MRLVIGTKSYKVSVPEGAAGSPPFYGEFQASVLEAGVSPVLVEWFHGLAWGCWCGRDHGLGWDSFRPGVVRICFWAPGPPPHSGFIVARSVAHAEWPGRPLDVRRNVWRVVV